MRPSEMRAEIEQLQRLLNRYRAFTWRLQEENEVLRRDLERSMTRENAEPLPRAFIVLPHEQLG